jgi:hypothetical protein
LSRLLPGGSVEEGILPGDRTIRRCESIRVLPLVALAGLLLGAATAAANDAWVLDVSAYPTEVVVNHVASQVYGAVPPGQGTGEVKVETYVLANGEDVPLPAYDSDGTPAAENEIFWSVALERADCAYHPPSSVILLDFVGRTLAADWSSCHNPGPSDLRFRVTVVAVRGAGSVSVDPTSFGRVKAEYR